MLKRILFLLLALGLTGLGQADQALENAVLQQEAALKTAMAGADSATLDRLLGDDFHAVWPDEAPADKAEQKNCLTTRFDVDKVETSQVKVRLYNGDTAVVTGLLTFQGLYNGKPMDVPRRFTHVWVKQGHDWKLVSRHLSRSEK